MKRTPMKLTATALVVGACLALTACSEAPKKVAEKAADHSKQQSAAVTPADAKKFIDNAEAQLLDLIIEVGRADWVNANFITDDTSKIAADANEKFTNIVVKLANQAARYNDLDLDYDTTRKLNKLKLALTLPAPQDAAKTTELSKIVSDLSGMYGKGKYCKADGKCLNLGEMSSTLATSRDYDELLDVWQGWRTVAPQMKPLYQRQVKLTNEGAAELGNADTGA
ncbi:MAG: M2 family metallopeptidase, partial [Algicola sp.]|nr:M2 family metallopeptidase [Algicola sp.]